MRWAFFATACLALPGCLGEVALPSLATRGAPEAVTVAGGSVTLAGPPGYCVDRRGSRPGGDPAFVLFASCAALTGSGDAMSPFAPALLTASVEAEPGDGELPSLEGLQDFVTSEVGRITLARDGGLGSLEVLENRIAGDALLLRLRDNSGAASEGLAPDYWRGLFVVEGRLVTVTVNGFIDQAFGPADGETTLLQLVDKIRDGSAVTEGS